MCSSDLPNYLLLVILFLGALAAHYILNQRFRMVYMALGITSGMVLLVALADRITGAGLDPEVIVLGGMIPALAWFLF